MQGVLSPKLVSDSLLVFEQIEKNLSYFGLQTDYTTTQSHASLVRMRFITSYFFLTEPHSGEPDPVHKFGKKSHLRPH